MTILQGPTASQAYLALDILSGLNAETSKGIDKNLHDSAVATLQSALLDVGWTGKTAKCSEYGKPPTSLDPEAQDAVRKTSLIMERLAKVTTETPILDVLADIRQIVQE